MKTLHGIVFIDQQPINACIELRPQLEKKNPRYPNLNIIKSRVQALAWVYVHV